MEKPRNCTEKEANVYSVFRYCEGKSPYCDRVDIIRSYWGTSGALLMCNTIFLTFPIRLAVVLFLTMLLKIDLL